MTGQQVVGRRGEPPFVALPVVEPGLTVLDALAGDGFFTAGEYALPLPFGKAGAGSLCPPLTAEPLAVTGRLTMELALRHVLWDILIMGVGVGREHAFPILGDDRDSDVCATWVDAAYQRLGVSSSAVLQPNGKRRVFHHHGAAGIEKNADIAVVLRRHQGSAVFCKHVDHVRASFRKNNSQ